MVASVDFASRVFPADTDQQMVAKRFWACQADEETSRLMLGRGVHGLFKRPPVIRADLAGPFMAFTRSSKEDCNLLPASLAAQGKGVINERPCAECEALFSADAQAQNKQTFLVSLRPYIECISLSGFKGGRCGNCIHWNRPCEFEKIPAERAASSSRASMPAQSTEIERGDVPEVQLEEIPFPYRSFTLQSTVSTTEKKTLGCSVRALKREVLRQLNLTQDYLNPTMLGNLKTEYNPETLAQLKELDVAKGDQGR